MTTAAEEPVSAQQIQTWLVEWVVEQTQIDPAKLRPSQRWETYGIDSLQLVSLVGLLEDRLGCRFTSNPFVRHPTIVLLSHFIADQLAQGRTRIDPRHR